VKLPINCIGLLLVAVSLVNSPLSFCQTQNLDDTLLESHEKKADKVKFLYRTSNLYFLSGTVLDMTSTAHVLNHPTMAQRGDGSILMHYHGIETGWAGYFGNRSTFAAVSANVGLNAGLSFLGEKVYRRGGKWRYVAIALNVLKGTDNLVAGVHNIQYNANQHVRMATGYSGPIVWSH